MKRKLEALKVLKLSEKGIIKSKNILVFLTGKFVWQVLINLHHKCSSHDLSHLIEIYIMSSQVVSDSRCF